MSGADVDPIRGQKFAPFLLVSPEPLSRDQNRSERLPGVIDEHLMEVGRCEHQRVIDRCSIEFRQNLGSSVWDVRQLFVALVNLCCFSVFGLDSTPKPAPH